MKDKIKYTYVTPNTVDQNRFVSIDDFKDSVTRGGEVNFEWNNRDYWIAHPNGTPIIYESDKPETTKHYANVDELLNHKLDGEPLRRIVTKLEIWDRTV